MPAKYVKALLKGNKNDFRDAEAVAEAVQLPTMRFVATKTAEQLDLQGSGVTAKPQSFSMSARTRSPLAAVRCISASWSNAVATLDDLPL